MLLPFDLHVLGMPPAFNLSQDQTLQFKSKIALELARATLLLNCCSLGIANQGRLLQLASRPIEGTHTNYLLFLLMNSCQYQAAFR
jgi:hypothetical protein